MSRCGRICLMTSRIKMLASAIASVIASALAADTIGTSRPGVTYKLPQWIPGGTVVRRSDIPGLGGTNDSLRLDTMSAAAVYAVADGARERRFYIPSYDCFKDEHNEWWPKKELWSVKTNDHSGMSRRIDRALLMDIETNLVEFVRVMNDTTGFREDLVIGSSLISSSPTDIVGYEYAYDDYAAKSRSFDYVIGQLQLPNFFNSFYDVAWFGVKGKTGMSPQRIFGQNIAVWQIAGSDLERRARASGNVTDVSNVIERISGRTFHRPCSISRRLDKNFIAYAASLMASVDKSFYEYYNKGSFVYRPETRTVTCNGYEPQEGNFTGRVYMEYGSDPPKFFMDPEFQFEPKTNNLSYTWTTNFVASHEQQVIESSATKDKTRRSIKGSGYVMTSTSFEDFNLSSVVTTNVPVSFTAHFFTFGTDWYLGVVIPDLGYDRTMAEHPPLSGGEEFSGKCTLEIDCPFSATVPSDLGTATLTPNRSSLTEHAHIPFYIPSKSSYEKIQNVATQFLIEMNDKEVSGGYICPADKQDESAYNLCRRYHRDLEERLSAQIGRSIDLSALQAQHFEEVMNIINKKADNVRVNFGHSIITRYVQNVGGKIIELDGELNELEKDRFGNYLNSIITIDFEHGDDAGEAYDGYASFLPLFSRAIYWRFANLPIDK